MTLTRCEEHIVTHSTGYGVPRTHYFSCNSKIPKTGHFWLNWEYLKKQKWLVLSLEVAIMTQGLEQSLQNRSGYHLGTTVYEL